MITLSLSNFSNDLSIFQEIFVRTGCWPNSNLARVSKRFKEIHEALVIRSAECFINKVNRSLWCHKKLPPIGTQLTLEESKNVLRAATKKVRESRKLLCEDGEDLFTGKSSAAIAATPELFQAMLSAANEVDRVDLVNLLQRDLPAELKITTRDEQVAAVSRHVELNLSYRQTIKLPDSFGKLSALKKLNLSHNIIQSLPQSFGNLSALTLLYLSYNQIRSLPDSFGNLTSLTLLYLSYNQIQRLPDSFGKLSALRELDLSFNNVESLPDSFGNLTSLTLLILHYNELRSLPESFGNLTSLTRLVLSYNKVQRLPDSFANLKNLKNLIIHINPPELAHHTSSIETLVRLRQRGCEIECDQDVEKAIQKASQVFC